MIENIEGASFIFTHDDVYIILLVDIKNCAPFPPPAAAAHGFESLLFIYFFLCVHASAMRKILQNANIGKCTRSPEYGVTKRS